MCREQRAHWQMRVQGHNQLEKQTKKSMRAMRIGRGLRGGGKKSDERLRDKIRVQVDAASGARGKRFGTHVCTSFLFCRVGDSNFSLATKP